MYEFFKNLGILVATLLLAGGGYLIYNAVSNSQQDAAAGLLTGAALCSFGLMAALSSARTAFLIRDWKRHAHHE